MISSIYVNGDNVEILAAVRNHLRRAYRLSAANEKGGEANE